ncbi:MAG: ABC transporter ATP-binding protein [Solirubrobacteraceae bacterium]
MTQTLIPTRAPAGTQVVSVKGLRVRYGETVAVDGVSLSIGRGEIFGILGPNGAGKTTTVECIAGLRRAEAGTIEVLGLNPQEDRDELRNRVGVQLQAAQLPDKLRVVEALQLFASFYANPDDPERLLELLGLPSKRDTRFSSLSGGQRQRLSIALALIGRPELAILDELTTGLDPQARRETWKLIEQVRDEGVTVILVTHFMEEAERLCDRLALLHHGRVIAIDTPAALATGAVGRQSISFRPSRPLELESIQQLPGVSEVSEHGGRLTVAGSGDLIATVIEELVRRQVIPEQTRVEQSTLDDAFVALTADADGADHPQDEEPR